MLKSYGDKHSGKVESPLFVATAWYHSVPQVLLKSEVLYWTTGSYVDNNIVPL